MNLFSAKWMVIVLMVLFSISFSSGTLSAQAKLTIKPDKTVLSQQLLKEPIKFFGSGWGAGETVVIELLIPKGIEMRGLGKEEDRVGIAVGTCNEKGDFETTMGTLATLNWFFQVAWIFDDKTTSMKSSFEKANPLPPGEYEILATGAITDKECRVYFEILPHTKGQ
ncbi:MAG: hypothetical protein HXY44_16525 [Syntrophaceae bacterium]|nr:hypothetical protein [Syntrophaceae bacterium]